MNTMVWIVDKESTDTHNYPQLKKPGRLLGEGKVIAFPTETVYGLGANALDSQAVKGIFEAKGRPSDNPLIVHIAEESMLGQLVDNVGENAKKLIDAYWPGPLTIIFPKKNTIPDEVTGNLSTVAVRMPNHPIAIALIRESGVPLAAPSANTSGRPSPTTAEHVISDLHGKIPGIVDGGPTGVGLESTVIDCTVEPPVILRPGGITREQIEMVIGEIAIDPHFLKTETAPKSPGMKYRHYAPSAPLVLFDGDASEMKREIEKMQGDGKIVGVMTVDEHLQGMPGDRIYSLGSNGDLTEIASKLYDVLRKFDQTKVDIIISEVFPDEGVGAAIMNRLRKASQG